MATLTKTNKLLLHWHVKWTGWNRKHSCVPAMDSYWTVLTKLLLCLVNLTNEIYKSITRFGHPLFWPVNKLELANSSWATISCICHFDLAQYVLWHVVFSNGIHYKALVPDWAITGPILVAFLLKVNQSNYNTAIKTFTGSILPFYFKMLQKIKIVRNSVVLFRQTSRCVSV